MWGWEQGRLDYFQYEELRKIAKFGATEDLRQASRADLQAAVGLPFFPDNPHYRPWRNYGRLFQIAMIAIPVGRHYAEMTEVGEQLAGDGKVTSDQYLHFLARSTTDPTPALSTWNHTAELRYPLLFALRFLLARAYLGKVDTKVRAIVGAYRASGFRGDEGQEEFLPILDLDDRSPSPRQANESIKVLAQLSYLTASQDEVTVSLAQEDALNLFCELVPIGGAPLRDRAAEIRRRAGLFRSANIEFQFEYPETVVSDLQEAGFIDTHEFMEGRRVRRSHLVIERNQKIRTMFFSENPICECDLCGMNTRRAYPWTSRLLEVHHLLPLCSGARTSNRGTLLDDLVANCPTCHRAVHRYYDRWLQRRSQVDFTDSEEAKHAYAAARAEHRHAVGAHA